MFQPQRLGLTGGIGSGKSSVVGFLAELGASVIDLDAVSRSLTVAGGLAIQPITTAFGAQLIDQQGALNRRLMRELVFSDASARQRLQAIMHPLIEIEVQRWLDAIVRLNPSCLVFEVPLLVEGGYWRQRLDKVLVVDCSEQTQIQRVVARSRLDFAAVQAIIAAQAPRAQRLHAADAVIFNDGISLMTLRQQVTALAPGCGLSLVFTPHLTPTSA